MKHDVRLELETFEKYGLFWASSQMMDDDGEVLADGCYVYRPEYFSETFFVLFDKLAQLNDYCFHQLITSHERLDDFFAQREAVLKDKNSAAEDFDYLDTQIPMWEDNVEVVTRASAIVLLCSFTEWGLKLVSQELGGAVPRKTSRTMSDVQFLLDHLKHGCALHLTIPDDVLAVVDSFRVVRNSFAHGHWARVREQLDAVSLRDCVQAVSLMFEHIEHAARRSPWGRPPAGAHTGREQDGTSTRLTPSPDVPATGK